MHREALVAKTLGRELRFVLDNVAKTINIIKSRPKQSGLFPNFVKKWDLTHEGLLLHMEVRWLSRGRVLSRVHELNEEMHVFFTRGEN